MPKLKPVKKRFWSKVNRASRSMCWQWEGHTDKDGYGIFWFDGENRRAHRIAYMLYYDICPPNNLLVMHKCDTPNCCNPAHLILGTHKDNIQDMIKKNRCYRKGENAHCVKLTEQQVIKIRELYKPRHYTGRRLAKEFGVSPATITLIAQRKLWGHI